MTDYDALKAYGHSPAKAAEILLDAQRGDGFCRGWIAVVRNALAAGSRRAKTPKAVECEASQSGGEAVTPNLQEIPTSSNQNPKAQRSYVR